MKIEYLGHSSFMLTADDGTRLVTDPYMGIGYEMKPTEADYVTCSHFHFDHGYTEAVRGAKLIAQAGEYRCGAFQVCGIASYHDEVQGAKRGKNVIYVMEADGIRVCHMGDIGEPLTDRLAQQIGKVDVLMIPIGGTYTIDAGEALEYIERIAPKMAVAMHFKSAGCMLDIATEQDLMAKAVGRYVQTGSEIPTAGMEGKIIIPARK